MRIFLAREKSNTYFQTILNLNYFLYSFGLVIDRLIRDLEFVDKVPFQYPSTDISVRLELMESMYLYCCPFV